MENGSIQLPFGFVPDKNPGGEIQFNLPLNYKKDLLFTKLPLAANLNDPAIDDVIKNGNVDKLAVQKYLLATGLLEDTIQENLEMIVNDGEFNNTSVRRALDLKYPSVMKKPTPLEYIFKDRAKFDVQNPIVGSLYNQLKKTQDKINEKQYLKQISTAPNIKDLELGNRLKELRDFNDQRRNKNDDDDNNDDDNDRGNNNNSGNNSGLPPPAPLPPLSTPSSSRNAFPPTPPTTVRKEDERRPSSSSSSSSSLTPTQRFLLRPEREAEAIAESTAGPSRQRVTVASDAVRKLFPDSKKILQDISEEPTIIDDDDVDDVNDNATLQSLSKGELPKELKFFSGGKAEIDTLRANVINNVGVLNNSNAEFLDFLSSDIGRNLMITNKLKIHIETGQIFHDNQITGESIFNFLRNQEDITKKLLKINIAITDDFDYYVREVLSNVTDDTNDLNSNSTSKFLFYHFNTLRQSQGKNFYKIRHSIISDDTFVLEEIQNKNWQYFITTLLEISNSEYESETVTDLTDRVLIEQTIDNLNYLRIYYDEVFENTGYYLLRSLQAQNDLFIKEIEEDLSREIFYNKKIKETTNHTEFLQKMSKYFYKTGKLPGHDEMAIIPRGVTPTFVKENQLINPFELYEKFEFTKSHGLVSVQFLAALNVFVGGDKNTSKNAMSEFFSNLTLQALSIDDDRIEIRFNAIEKLNKEMKEAFLHEQKSFSIVDFQPTYIEIKDEIELINEEVERNILSSTRLVHPQAQDTEHLTFPNTTEEIFEQDKKEKKLKKKISQAVGERDEEVTDEIVKTAVKDLVESVLQLEDEIPMETFETISNVNIVVESEKKDIETHIKETIKKDNSNLFSKIEIEEVPDNREIAIPSSSGAVLRRSKRTKKPYEKYE